MPVPRLNSCCCGCTLKVGAQIIGTLESIFMSITLIASIIICSYLSNPLNFPELSPDDRNILYGLYVTIAVITSMQLSISIMMLIGISSENPRLIRPWLIFAIFNMLTAIVVATLNSMVYSNNLAGTISSIITSLLVLGIKAYFILVIYNNYLDMTTNVLPTYPYFARDGGP